MYYFFITFKLNKLNLAQNILEKNHILYTGNMYFIKKCESINKINVFVNPTVAAFFYKNTLYFSVKMIKVIQNTILINNLIVNDIFSGN